MCAGSEAANVCAAELGVTFRRKMSPTHKWHKSGEKRNVLSSANHISGLQKKDVEALVAFPDLIWKDYFSGAGRGEGPRRMFAGKP
ncbi:hypothetical protein AVEN_270580-1 [Araneus ventricosus]|uniref:Uncharacterized protein n=1 Tax=Araneus ventricosus TaxID=182803 RepID=A0A4Y2B8G6_ARAVE|nr:hypothetical protein AVEN_270580-1 [Araneus ventricosus]